MHIIFEITFRLQLLQQINVTVVVPGGQTYDAEIVGLDTVSDIALLKIEGENFEYCSLGDSDES